QSAAMAHGAGGTSLTSEAERDEENRTATVSGPRPDALAVSRELRFASDVDTQQQRMLERLRRAGDQPVAFAELRAAGIDFPAAVVSELQLNGYAIDRVYDRGRLVGVRLLEPESRYKAAPRRRRLRLWRHR
ncbi:MAG TPA: hypothetical protein VKG38_18145, partial [Solirubrobacteraceae bacterium]|nr:hypothetical protein [Solirubrobacteraceae bacterium]